MNIPIRFRSIFATLVLSALAPAVLAYDLGSPPHRWWPGDVPDVTVDANGMGGGGYGTSATINALTAWNNVSPGIPILNPSSGDASGINPGDGVSDVIFSDPFKVCTGSCLAATFTTIDENQTGTCIGSPAGDVQVARITETDVVFNTKPGIGGGPFASSWIVYGETCSNDYYIDTVAMHEAGHMIGLSHSSVAAALMYPSVAACNNKIIAPDDANGRNALYNCTDFVPDGAPFCGDGQCNGNETNCDCPGDCTTPVTGSETNLCGDSVDNDCDLAVDCADSDCTGDAACQVCSPTEPTEVSCNDGQDNDCDGLVDSADPDCGSGGRPSGASCEFDYQCTSGKCKGKPGFRTCR